MRAALYKRLAELERESARLLETLVREDASDPIEKFESFLRIAQVVQGPHESLAEAVARAVGIAGSVLAQHGESEGQRFDVIPTELLEEAQRMKGFLTPTSNLRSPSAAASKAQRAYRRFVRSARPPIASAPRLNSAREPGSGALA